MAEARQRAEWDRTAAWLALLANCHRDPKKSRGFQPADFHPLPPRRKPQSVPKVGIGILKEVFVDRQPPGGTR